MTTVPPSTIEFAIYINHLSITRREASAAGTPPGMQNRDASRGEFGPVPLLLIGLSER